MLNESDGLVLFREAVHLVRLTGGGAWARAVEETHSPAEITPQWLDWVRFFIGDLDAEERAYKGVEACIARIERLLAIADGQGVMPL